MSDVKGHSTVLLEKRVIALLKKVKNHPRETYNETIEGLAQEKLHAKKAVIAGSMFGKFPRTSGRGAQQIKDEMRAGWT